MVCLLAAVELRVLGAGDVHLVLLVLPLPHGCGSAQRPRPPPAPARLRPRRLSGAGAAAKGPRRETRAASGVPGPARGEAEERESLEGRPRGTKWQPLALPGPGGCWRACCPSGTRRHPLGKARPQARLKACGAEGGQLPLFTVSLVADSTEKVKNKTIVRFNWSTSDFSSSPLHTQN